MTLLTKLQEAKEGSRELDHAIWMHLGARHEEDWDHEYWLGPKRMYKTELTTSLDAALALVREVLKEDGLAAWDVGFAYNGGPYHARIFFVPELSNQIEVTTTHEHSAPMALLCALIKAAKDQHHE